MKIRMSKGVFGDIKIGKELLVHKKNQDPSELEVEEITDQIQSLIDRNMIELVGETAKPTVKKDSIPVKNIQEIKEKLMNKNKDKEEDIDEHD